MCKNLKDIIKFYSDIIWHYSIVILGFIPRIHEKQPLSRHYRACPDNLDPRNKSEDDYRKKMSVKPEDDKKLVKFEYDNLVAQCGRSMIEMLGVLAIIGVLSVGGIAGYSKAMEKFKINKTIQQISEIAANIRTLYAQQKDFNGLNNETAIQMGVIPDDLDTITGGYSGSIIHAWGNGVVIYGNLNYFHIIFNPMTKEACMALATTDWGNISSTGVVGIGINNFTYVITAIDDLDHCATKSVGNGYFACSQSLPISPAVAAQYCGKSDGAGTVYNGFLISFKK